MPVRPSIGVARRIVRETTARDVPTFAAAVAYYTFVSLVPLLALALIAAAATGGAALEAAVADLAGRYLLPTGREAVVEALRGTRGRGSATVLGVVALAWSSLKLFRGVDLAFARVYGTGDRGFLHRVRDGAVALVSVGVGTLSVVVIAGALGTLARRTPLAGLVPVLTLVVLGGAFFPLYYVLPDADVAPREALPGTAVAAVGWTLLGTAFGVYAAYAGSEGGIAVYGALGGLVLLVTWFYLAGLVVLVGAVTNAVLAGRLGPDRQPGTDRQVQHPRGRHGGTMGDEGAAGGDADPGTGDDATAGTPADGTESAADARTAAGSDSEANTGVEEGPASGPDAGGEAGPTGADGRRAGSERGPGPGERSPEAAALDDRIDALRDDLEDFRADVDDRTLHRDEVESELKRYVRRRVRRGHARGWGPYLVLLYGTVMTLGAFYFLEGGWAILAMVVLFLSTLGLYTLFVLVGMGLNLLGVPGRAYERVREFRD